jgi:hypothetical protein
MARLLRINDSDADGNGGYSLQIMKPVASRFLDTSRKCGWLSHAENYCSHMEEQANEV